MGVLRLTVNSEEAPFQSAEWQDVKTAIQGKTGVILQEIEDDNSILVATPPDEEGSFSGIKNVSKVENVQE